jgi:hypothetical protein
MRVADHVDPLVSLTIILALEYVWSPAVMLPCSRPNQDAEKHREMIRPPMNADGRRLKKTTYPRLSAFICGPFAFFSSLLSAKARWLPTAIKALR